MFQITIRETTIEERPAGKDWEVVKHDEGQDKIFGYTPEIIKKKEVERKIYEQITETLDLVKVIDAVNCIKC